MVKLEPKAQRLSGSTTCAASPAQLERVLARIPGSSKSLCFGVFGFHGREGVVERFDGYSYLQLCGGGNNFLLSRGLCKSGFGLRVCFSTYGVGGKFCGERDFVLSPFLRVGGGLQCSSNSGLFEGCELCTRIVGLGGGRKRICSFEASLVRRHFVQTCKGS